MHTLTTKTSTTTTLAIMTLSLCMATSSFGMIGFFNRHATQKATSVATPLASQVTPLALRADNLAFDGIKQTDKRDYRATRAPLTTRYREIIQQKELSKTRNKLAQIKRMLVAAQEDLQHEKNIHNVCKGEKDARDARISFMLRKVDDDNEKLAEAHQIIENHQKELYPYATPEEITLATQGLEEIQKAYYNLICSPDKLTQQQSNSLDLLGEIIQNGIKAPALAEQTRAQCESLEYASEGSSDWLQKTIGRKYVQIGNYLYVKEYEKASDLLRQILESLTK